MIFKTLAFTITLCLTIPTVLCKDDRKCEAELIVGTEGKIACLPSNGIPYRPRWWRKSQSLVNGTEFRIENDGLVILNVQPSHKGDYDVRWSDPDSSSQSSKDASVYVLAPVTLEHWKPTVDVRNGSEAYITMNNGGRPSPSCRWYDKYGIMIQEKSFSCSLYIKFVKDADTGMYTCIGTNRVNVATASVTLTIQGESAGTPPHPLVSVELASVTPKSLTLRVEGPSTGENVTSVHCIYVVLNPKIPRDEEKVVWPLAPGINTYTLDNLREGFIYRLHCASVGVDKLLSVWSPNLDVKLTPPTPDIWVQVFSQEVLRLSWEVPPVNVLYENNQILEYQLSYKNVSRFRSKWIDGPNSRTVLVTSLSTKWDIFQPGKLYYAAKVRARNQAGWSKWSPEIKAGGMTS